MSDVETAPKPAPKPKPAPVTRQAGTSILPTARVQRIIKADRDVDICSKEATFLISLATELFVKKVTDEAYTMTRLDKRKVIVYKDLAKAVQQNEYLEFLKDAVPSSMTLSAALAERDAKMQQTAQMEAAILDGTLQESGDEHDNDEPIVEAAENEEVQHQDRPAKKVKSRSKAAKPIPADSAAQPEPEAEATTTAEMQVDQPESITEPQL